MSKEIETPEGTKEIVYTADEYKAKEGELIKTQEDLAEARRISAEKGQNFKKFSELSKEEISAMDANVINLLKNEEKLLGEMDGLKTKLTEKEQKEQTASKNETFTFIHKGDEATKKLLEEKYGLLSAMPETTPQEIAARAKEAAKLAGIQIDQRNPLFTSFNGESPQFKAKEEFTDTPKGKEAMSAVLGNLGFSDKK